MKVRKFVCTVAAVGALSLAHTATAAEIHVSIENLTPTGGLFLTPMWVGFHNGGFDTYDLGAAASAGLERIAEDGNPAPLRSEFAASAAGTAGGMDSVVFAPGGVFTGAPVFEPGETAVATFDVSNPDINRYFSFASMVIPSNDAFIANGDPLAHPLFDSSGNFLGPVTITIFGTAVRDAGTEENTEQDAAFINQAAANTPVPGNDPLGVVSSHLGFIDSVGNPGGTPTILGGTVASGDVIDAVLGDFTTANYVLARITITPEPTTGLLLASVMGLWGVTRRWRTA